MRIKVTDQGLVAINERPLNGTKGRQAAGWVELQLALAQVVGVLHDEYRKRHHYAADEPV